MKKKTKKCRNCGESFEFTRSTAKFCSDKCRKAKHRQQNPDMKREENRRYKERTNEVLAKSSDNEVLTRVEKGDGNI